MVGLFAIGAILAVVGTLTGDIEWIRRNPSLTDRARVGLHGARRRLEVSQIRYQVRSDGARLRRELDREFDAYDRRFGGGDDA